MAKQKAKNGISQIRHLAKRGEVYYLAAMQQIEPEKIQAFFQKAADEFQQALTLAEDEPNVSPKTLSWTQAHLGATNLALADLAEKDQRTTCLNDAEKYLRAALKLPPDSDPQQAEAKYAWAYAHLGEVCTWQAVVFIYQADKRTQYYTWAINAFNKAIAIDESYVWGIAHRGLAYRMRGLFTGNPSGDLNSDNKQALQDFKKAYELDQNYYWVAAYLAALYRERGIQRIETEHFAEGAEDLRKALEFFQYVTVFDPFIFAQMSIMEVDPIGLGAESPPTDTDEAVKLFKLYRSAVSEFRKKGPTGASREKINAFYTAKHTKKTS